MGRTCLFLLICIHLVYGSPPQCEYALFTIPKAGSHLLIKALHLMCDTAPQWHTEPLSPQETYSQNKYPYSHFALPEPLFGFYSHSEHIKKIIGVRDLRDVCISIIYQIQKGTWPEFTGNKQKIEWFRSISFDDQLMFVICQEYVTQPPPALLQLGIAQSSAQAVALCKDPTVLVCRYEDLIGPRGGGDAGMQKQEVQRLAHFLELNPSPSEVESIASKLYGNTVDPFGQGEFSHYLSTFRSGKIGGWKKLFKERHIRAFKERLGASLIALGYETDNNW